MGQYYRRDYRVSLISKMKYTLTLACLVSATLGVQLETKPFKRLIPADVLRFQRQLFRVNKVQGVWTPGDLVPGTLLWREQVCQTKVRPSCCGPQGYTRMSAAEGRG